MLMSLYQTNTHNIYKVDVLLFQTKEIKEMISFLSQLWNNNMGQFACTEKYSIPFSDGTLNFDGGLLSIELYNYSHTVLWHNAYTCQLFYHFFEGTLIHTYELEIRKEGE